MGNAEIAARILEEEVPEGLSFTCGPTSVNRAAYAMVGAGLRLGQLHFQLRGHTRVGLYFRRPGSAPMDTFVFGHNWEPGSIGGRALLVHEATHAHQDRSRAHMLVPTAEAAAYLAQSLYFRLVPNEWQTFKAYSLATRPSDMDRETSRRGTALLDVIEAVADRILREGTPRLVTAGELADLEAAVAGYPLYDHRVHEMLDFDGWRRRAPRR